MHMIYDGSDRATWLEARRAPAGDGHACISASEVSAILGLNPWMTELELWARKRGLLEDVADNSAMEWGRILEPVVIAHYGSKLEPGLEARPSSAIYSHPDLDWLRATPDGFVFGQGWDGDGAPVQSVKGGIEAKTTGSRWEDGLPPYYDSQGRIQMAVCGLPWVDVPVLAAGRHYDCFRIVHDEAVEQEILGLVHDWRERHLVRGEEPKAEPRDSEVLRSIYSRSSGRIVSLGPNGAWIHAELTRIGSEISELMRQKDELTTQAMQAMGDATYAQNSDGTAFSWKEQTQPIMEKVGERQVRVFRRIKALPKGVLS